MKFTIEEIGDAIIVNHRSNINMYMHYVQFRILHYRLATQYELYRMNIISIDKCILLDSVETLEHLLYGCDKTVNLWEHVLNVIKGIGFLNYTD